MRCAVPPKLILDTNYQPALSRPFAHTWADRLSLGRVQNQSSIDSSLLSLEPDSCTYVLNLFVPAMCNSCVSKTGC